MDDKFLQQSSLMSILKDAGEILCLKNPQVLLKVLSGHLDIPISTNIKVYIYQKTENSDDEYKNSPTNKSKEHHFFELQYDIKSGQDLGYIFNTAHMYPLDNDLNDTNTQSEKYLRLEFLCQYSHPLNADANKPPLKGIENRANEEQDILEINEASKTLQTKIIPNLVSLLDSLTLMPLDSKTLSEIFHSYGVNMRYLGRVAFSNLFHVQDICINEMITRILKQLLNAQIANSILEYQDEDESYEQSMFSRHPPISRIPKGIMK